MVIQQLTTEEKGQKLKNETLLNSSGEKGEATSKNILRKSTQGKLRGFRPKHRQAALKTRRERAAKNRLARYFRGAKKEQLGKLSVDRLASYGLDKKKKKQ